MHEQLKHFVAALLVLYCVVTAVQALGQAGAQESGCQAMLLIDVIDGDTVQGYIDTSDPEIAVRASLRLSGIDSPEVGGHARCAEERAKGDEARHYLTGLLAPALARPTRKVVRACAIGEDKYAGRRLGRLEFNQGGRWLDVSALLLERGFAIPYHGGRRGKTWCTCLQTGVCPSGYGGE